MSNSSDSIEISWHIDDVKSVDASLNDDQCREILKSLKENHDSTIGITWQVIYYAIQRFKNV